MEHHLMIHLRRFTHDDFPDIRQTLLDVHADAYADAMDNPFNQRFASFADHWGNKPTFVCVMGYDDDTPVGYSYGAPAELGKESWRKEWTNAPADRDTSTFFVSELMIRPRWRKTGLSSRLHDTLLDNRSEALACLTVDTRHPKVQALYESWGYVKVGENQAFDDSPLFAVMIKDLRGALASPTAAQT